MKLFVLMNVLTNSLLLNFRIYIFFFLVKILSKKLKKIGNLYHESISVSKQPLPPSRGHSLFLFSFSNDRGNGGRNRQGFVPGIVKFLCKVK